MKYIIYPSQFKNCGCLCLWLSVAPNSLYIRGQSTIKFYLDYIFLAHFSLSWFIYFASPWIACHWLLWHICDMLCCTHHTLNQCYFRCPFSSSTRLPLQVAGGFWPTNLSLTCVCVCSNSRHTPPLFFPNPSYIHPHSKPSLPSPSLLTFTKSSDSAVE